MRGILAGLASAALVLTGAAALDAKPRCAGKGRCVGLPQRTVTAGLARLLSASERPTFSDRVRFPALTDVFGADAPAAYKAIDAALLGFARPPGTARAAASSSGTAGSVGWRADGSTTQTGGTGNGPATDTGSLSDTATDTSRSASADRQTSWKVTLNRPCPNAAGFLSGRAEGATAKRVTTEDAFGKVRTIKVRYSVEGKLTGLVGSDARLKLTALNLDVVAAGTTGTWRGDALVRWGDAASNVAFTGEDAGSLAGDDGANVLIGLVAAAGDRLLVRAERIWRTPNRCAKLRLTAQPPRISSGQQAKVRAHLKSQDGGDVDQGRVRATAVGARVTPASAQPDDNGIARFTVTATTDAAALSTRAVSPAGIATATIALGKVGAFTATLEAVRTDTWTSHTTSYRRPEDDPPVCNIDSSGTELIRALPEAFTRSGIFYRDGAALVVDFLGPLVLNRNGSRTDSCVGSSSASDCGSDWTFDTLTLFELVNQGEFVQLKLDGGLTNRPRIDCPEYSEFCGDPQPEIVNTPAAIPRAALRDPSQKTIVLEGSTSTTYKADCAEDSVHSTTEQDEIKLEWKITLLRQ